MCVRVQGLSNDGESQRALDDAAKIRSRKQRELHTEWNTQVFDKIQGRLQTAVGTRHARDIEQRLKQQYDQYLHTTNTKVGRARRGRVTQVAA